MLPTGFLTLPAPGDRALAGIHRKLRLRVLRGLLDERQTTRGARLAPYLRAALAKAPDLLFDALGAPDVIAPLLAAESGAITRDAALTAAIPFLLAALASAAETIGESFVWRAPVPAIGDARRARWARLDPPARAIVVSPAGLVIETATGDRMALPDGPAPFHALSARLPRLALSEIDTNPLADREAHPDKTGNAIDLGGRAVDEWRDALAAALSLIELALPAWHAELAIALERIVPVGWDDQRHLSASYREAPGLCYLTLHPDPVTLAEAVIHETQHGKLNALTWIDAVLDNGYQEWTASPVRPDLRPLMGVLLAVHAFVPVAALHRELARGGHPLATRPDTLRRRAEVWDVNERGLATLDGKAQPTRLGARLLADLHTLHEATRPDAI